MVMNFTNLTGADSIHDIALFTNNASNGILFNGFIIVFFIIILLILISKQELPEALSVASFVTFIISAILYSIYLITIFIPILMLILAIFSTYYIYAKGE